MTSTLMRILSNSVAIPESSGGCWLWQGHIKPNGYGTLGLKRDGRWKTEHAHRVAYEVFIGSVPEGHDLDHLCRVRHCVSPNHLEPVTRSENLRRSPVMNRQTNKTHCPKGHPYSGVNSRGGRICKICAAEATRKYHNRSKAS